MAHLRTIPSLKILTLINMPIKDAGVRHLSGHKGLEALCLNRSQITDRGLASLGRMRSLKKLEISGVSAYDPFTRKGIKFLAQLASLEYLSLEYISVSLGELEYLNTLKNLKDLRLDIIRQGDSALNISGLTKLEKLDLNIHTERGKGKIYRDALQDQDVAIFSQLSSLKDLKCNMKKVSEREVRGLANLTRLERLSVVTSLNDNALACLIPLTKLQVLTINGNFSDKGLKHLEGIKSLRSLWIDTPNDFSPQAVQQLFAVLPNLQGFSTSKGRYSRAADNSIQFYERSSKSK